MSIFVDASVREADASAAPPWRSPCRQRLAIIRSAAIEHVHGIFHWGEIQVRRQLLPQGTPAGASDHRWPLKTPSFDFPVAFLIRPAIFAKAFFNSFK